jgi:hypothetical protein
MTPPTRFILFALACIVIVGPVSAVTDAQLVKASPRQPNRKLLQTNWQGMICCVHPQQEHPLSLCLTPTPVLLQHRFPG